MHLSHILQCPIQNQNVHISVLNGALWDMEQVHYGICKLSQLVILWNIWVYFFNFTLNHLLSSTVSFLPQGQSLVPEYSTSLSQLLVSESVTSHWVSYWSQSHPCLRVIYLPQSKLIASQWATSFRASYLPQSKLFTSEPATSLRFGYLPESALSPSICY